MENIPSSLWETRGSYYHIYNTNQVLKKVHEGAACVQIIQLKQNFIKEHIIYFKWYSHWDSKLYVNWVTQQMRC